MRIAMISTPFIPVPPKDYGGTELIVHELVEGLLDRGHQVTLFATGDSQTRATLEAVYDEAIWPPETFTELHHVSWAMRRAVEGDFDLVHAHSPCALALGRLAPGLPLVYTIHHAQDPVLSRYYVRFPGVDFVCISRDQCRRETGTEWCTVIHHGLDAGRYQWSGRAEPYVCFVGRLAREKGPVTAIDAAARAGVALRMAGSIHPPDQAYVEAKVLRRLTAPGVTWLGKVGPDRKIPLLRDARALLAPIEWNEPFGLILIEALLSGCPVVAFGRGAVPELVEHGVTGFIATSESDIVELIRPGGPVDALDRRRIREIAVRRFNRSRMVVDYERVYVAAAARARRSGLRPITAA
ncbi:MAG TPA: glycosyltransferase family 4 protein [Gemmatimonadales bacterium]|nr:glycosyltransferase family 4 protein [Gemmatimonadales bacterium]